MSIKIEVKGRDNNYVVIWFRKGYSYSVPYVHVYDESKVRFWHKFFNDVPVPLREVMEGTAQDRKWVENYMLPEEAIDIAHQLVDKYEKRNLAWNKFHQGNTSNLLENN